MQKKSEKLKNFKVVSTVCENKMNGNISINPKFRKFCLANQGKKVTSCNDQKILNDKGKSYGFNLNKYKGSGISFHEESIFFNPIFSSLDIHVEAKNDEQETFCSEVEDIPSAEFCNILPKDGSESLFSTDSVVSKKGVLQNENDFVVCEYPNHDSNVLNTSEPLLLESSSSFLGVTQSKNSSFMDHYNKQIRQYNEETNDFHIGKVQDGENSKKKDENEFTEQTESNYNKWKSLLCQNIEKSNTSESEVLTINSSSIEINNSEDDEYAIIISDSDDENNHTKTSSQLQTMVSSIAGTFNKTNNDEIDKFFDNIPLLGSPECDMYSRTFDPGDTCKINHSSKTGKSKNEEVIHDSDPKLKSQSSNESLNKTFSSSSKSKPNVTEVNISAKVQISIKIGYSKSLNEGILNAPVVNIDKNINERPTLCGGSDTDPAQKTQSFRSTTFRNQEDKSSKNLKKNIHNKQTKTIEFDESTSKILDEIYGKDKWQTPLLKRKTVEKRKNDKSMLDFFTLNRNESVTSDHVLKLKHNQISFTEMSPKTRFNKGSTTKCYSKTPLEIDKMWKVESNFDSSSSDKMKNKNVETSKKLPFCIDSDENIQAWADKDSNKCQLNNVIKNGNYGEKKHVPTTAAVKTKRKLFKPNKTCDEFSESGQNKNDKRNDISQIQDDALCFQFDKPKTVEKLGVSESISTPLKTESSNVNNQKVKDGNYSEKHSFLRSLDVNASDILCDLEALRYRQNYKALKMELTNVLFKLFNENIFENQLESPCSWNKKLLNTAGRCHLTRIGGVRKARIELSEKVLTSADRLRCTLIHEMCHAATWIFNGEDGHGKAWKAWAHKANSVFKELPKIKICHSYDIFYKYTYICKSCKAKSHAHSKSKKVENIRCKICHGTIEILLNKISKGQIVSTPVKSAIGFAKFVKENYSKVKQPNIAHAEVMKTLGENFSKLTVSQKELLKK